MGILQRGHGDEPSKMRAWVVPFVEGSILKGKIAENVVEGAEVNTDSATMYKGLSRSFIHQTVDHHALEYVRGNVHTNSIESFYSYSSARSRERI